MRCVWDTRLPASPTQPPTHSHPLPPPPTLTADTHTHTHHTSLLSPVKHRVANPTTSLHLWSAFSPRFPLLFYRINISYAARLFPISPQSWVINNNPASRLRCILPHRVCYFTKLYLPASDFFPVAWWLRLANCHLVVSTGDNRPH